MKNNSKRKLIALSIISALTISAFAGCSCSDSDSDKEEGSSKVEGTTISEEALLQQPLQFYYPTDSLAEDATQDPLLAADPTAENDANSGGDSSGDTSSDPVEPVTEIVEVTDAVGEVVTEIVEVTEPDGQKATDAEGEVVTEVVPVTTVVTVDTPSGNEGDVNTPEAPTQPPAEEYTPFMDGSWAMWIDISKNEDFIFQDQFIEVTFKIKDTTPDGVYDVVITNPDFANIQNGGTSLDADTVIDGKVFVNQDVQPQREISEADGFTVYGDHVAAKQGEEVKFYFNMKNNPGMVAMMFEFDYDRNAMDIVSCQAVGAFAEIAKEQLDNKQNALS